MDKDSSFISNPNLPSPPGKQKKQQEQPTPPVTPPEKEEKADAPNKTGMQKIYVVAGILLGLLFGLLLIKPNQTNKIEQPKPAAEENIIFKEIQGLKITDQELRGKITLLEGKIKLAEEKANAYEVGISTLKSGLEENQKKSTENRNYISTIYRQILDLELKVNAVGGGFKALPNKEPTGRVVNPYIGSSELP